MDKNNTLTELTANLSTVNNIVILLPESASRDALAAALALYLSLQEFHKQVTICYPKTPIVGWSHLVGVNKLTPKLGNKNFVISLDYIEGAIEKVSYNIEGNKFNLVIEPRGETNFSDKNVSYSYSGFSTDLIITVGAGRRENLGKLYTDNQSVFEQKPIAVLDNRTDGAVYGKYNLVQPAAAISEIATLVIKTGQLPIDTDIASNLYDGLVYGSRNFSVANVTSATFETAAWLLAQGARRSSSKVNEELPNREYTVSKASEAPQTPPDWLKPKIYKGSTLL